MKRLVPALLLMLAALPLAADDAAKKEPASTEPAVVDSPLVAAAKRSAKMKKPTIVITNETIAKSGANAHITTTSKSIAELPAPPPVSTVIPTDPNLRVVDKTKPVPHEARKRLEEAAARAEEDGPYGDDPARAERQLEVMARAAAKEKEAEKKPEKP
jgi:hypothetical protein